ncbi:MAG: FprA family A-type flavoprotein [Angelakisella sp.]|nr:FprA family A-type flavoprotein [Angelakisella sp.]
MATEIKNGVYSVGTLNPAMRTFDIVMETDYGTSYNSYLVKGTEKNALIDVCHLSFFNHYVANIQSVLPLEQIDYIILNHNEPDHSGALAKLLEKTGSIPIYTSQAGALYVKNITNLKNLDIHVVKEGDTLELGGKTLRFIPAPFLHWPDSMFTYLPQEQLVFTCDFLGSHYCEPYLFDHVMAYPQKYETALKGYYDAIFGPFPKYVENGLHKLKALDFSMVLPSHGPILTREKNGWLDTAISSYEQWCMPKQKDKKLIPVFYTSAYGNTRRLAEAVAQGVRDTVDADVEIYDMIEHDMSMLHELINHCDGFAIGTPTINRDTVPPTWHLLAGVDAINCMKKPCVVFGSFGWSGEGVPNVITRLSGLKMNLVADGLKVAFVPTEDDLAKAKELGCLLGKAVIG